MQESSMPEQGQSLGARGHLPSGYVVSSLWVLKQFAHPMPTGYMLSIFEKNPSICSHFTHWVQGEYLWKVLSNVPIKNLSHLLRVLSKSTPPCYHNVLNHILNGFFESLWWNESHVEFFVGSLEKLVGYVVITWKSTFERTLNKWLRFLMGTLGVLFKSTHPVPSG